jgi:integrase
MDLADLRCSGQSADMNSLVAEYLEAARSANTRRAYAADMSDFGSWGGLVPCSPEQVATYLAERAKILPPSTLRRRLSALASAHHDHGANDPTKHALVRRVMNGIERKHGVAVQQARALLIEDLTRIVDQTGNSLIDVRDRALLCIGFFAALRRSEFVALTVHDIDIAKIGLRITLRRSKTDQLGKSRTIQLPPREDALCPLRNLSAWIERSGIRRRQLFRRINAARVSSDCRFYANRFKATKRCATTPRTNSVEADYRGTLPMSCMRKAALTGSNDVRRMRSSASFRMG